MKSKGIAGAPDQTIDGGHEVNEVFFDDVKVPVENLVGRRTRAGITRSSCSATSASASPASAPQGAHPPHQAAAASGDRWREAA